MRLRPLITLFVLLASCGGAQAGPEVAADADVTTDATAAMTVLRCSDTTPVAAPNEWYRESPVYVGNEMPVDELQVWAGGKPDFVDVWIDRDHNGWVSLAFSAGAEERQRELETEFPDVGVVAVPVDWTREDLDRARDDVADWVAASPVADDIGYGIDVTTGYVAVDVPYLTDEVSASFTAEFDGDRVCVEGGDPADQPEPGPQPTAGEDWRLLADEVAGEPYTTGIATDQTQYDALWDSLALEAVQPGIDFTFEVVVHLGVVFSGSCPAIRLDDVVMENGLLYPVITYLDATNACTADANSRTYVVAVSRDQLPADGFTIQLGPDTPPGGSDEQTVVTADLSQPGAVTTDEQMTEPRSTPPEPEVLVSGAYVEPGFPASYAIYTHCGITSLGQVNGVWWYANGGDGSNDPYTSVPEAWQEDVDEYPERVTVDIELREGDPPTLTASLNGVDVVYLPGSEAAYGCA